MLRNASVSKEDMPGWSGLGGWQLQHGLRQLTATLVLRSGNSHDLGSYHQTALAAKKGLDEPAKLSRHIAQLQEHNRT